MIKQLSPASLAIIAIIVVVIVGGAFWSINTNIATAPGGQGCTQEAKVCQDGSVVGRTGPNCEFSECPTVARQDKPNFNSGVRGVVSIGPTCPVQKFPPDPACVDTPYATGVSVYSTDALANCGLTTQCTVTPIIVGNSDVDGAFTFPLPPGSYTLKAGSGKALPRCTSVEITVTSDQYVQTTVSCDSGIR